MEKKDRILYLDIIRIVACVMMVVQHSPKPDVGTNSILLSAISFLTYPCIGLFFMVSGALLLPVRQSSFIFYRHRLKKVAIPSFSWMFFYLLIGVILHQYDITSLPRKVLLIPLMPEGVPVLWFIYVLIGLYLFSPIISPWLINTSKKEIELFLTLWGVSLIIPILSGYLDITYGYYSILCYFGGYLGYFILGYYFHHYRIKSSYYCIAVLIATPILLYALCKYVGFKSTFHTYYYLSLFSASMVTGWFLLLKKIFEDIKINDIFNKSIINMSNACFGIYLIHIFVMRDILWKLDFFNLLTGINQIVVTSVLTIVLSYFITFVISKLPFSKYLIGY